VIVRSHRERLGGRLDLERTGEVGRGGAIERLLVQPQRQRRSRGDLLGELAGRRRQIGGVYHAVDEADAEGFCSPLAFSFRLPGDGGERRHVGEEVHDREDGTIHEEHARRR